MVAATQAKVLRQHSRFGILVAGGDGRFLPVTIVAYTHGLVAIWTDAHGCRLSQTTLIVLLNLARRLKHFIDVLLETFVSPVTGQLLLELGVVTFAAEG